MNSFVMDKKVRKTAAWLLVTFVCIVVLAEVLAHAVMTGWGSVQVSNVWIENKNGLMVRGKLYKPDSAAPDNPAPGVVYLHGYQNNRETSDPYAIELSRRGFVVIALDTLGRGNSENQFSEDEPGFDPTYGGDSAFEYLRSLAYVDAERCGLGGHSLGGEMSYTAAMSNPEVQAIVFSGFAYLENATADTPKNMLMIFGKYDEYRQRMTGTDDFETEWLSSPQTKAAIPEENPQFDTTYGSFSEGTARRVHMTTTTHVGESFDKGAIAEGVSWFNQALDPENPLSIPAERQVWRIKEIASLFALVFGVLSVIPLGILLLGSKPFSGLVGSPGKKYACSKKTFQDVFILNFVLSLLYLACVLIIFAIHIYVVPIDGVFPMMMVNGVVFWFMVINIIGFLFFRRWVKKNRKKHPEINYKELGLSKEPGKIRPDWGKTGKALLLSMVLFVFLYILEAGLEHFTLIDFRYKFPYASDLTPYRFLMFLLYFPLFLVGYLQVNNFLQAQLRPAYRKNWLKTVWFKTWRSWLVMLVPLLFHMALQYIPLYLTGLVPFVGPGGALVGFVINLEHMCVILALMIPISSVFYEATGSIYTGSFINALIVAWMFTSSSVIAPLPV